MITLVNAMMPRPPSWISSRMKAWPSGVKYVAVSTTMSPVTHAALVDVNSASSQDSGSPV